MTQKVLSGEKDALLYIWRSMKTDMPARTNLLRKINVYLEFTLVYILPKKIEKAFN